MFYIENIEGEKRANARKAEGGKRRLVCLVYLICLVCLAIAARNAEGEKGEKG